ncbi:peptidoglycan recognition protein-like [Achroia grisella]|uniref:peptidoglycan recognition protein-like n=1 Tax=Achroia grisella TaxID=688607 RepID=UPI0027D20750|nr:peptidoglycan recognition protein-like [Achroia grisella]
MQVIHCFVLVIAFQWSLVKGDCGVVSKSDWDGLNAVHVQYLPRPVDLVIIEHTVTPTCSTDRGCAELVRNIQTNHVESRNFWDIGYNFIIGGNGKVYEGAGWLHVGAHARGYNKRSLGIAFLGNFNNDPLKRSMVDALKALLRCGVENGHLTSDYHVVAHRQLISTESPGRKLYNEIRTWPNWLEDVSSIKN